MGAALTFSQVNRAVCHRRDTVKLKRAIVETLAKTKNNREKAAKILGIGERTLYRKIKEYNL